MGNADRRTEWIARGCFVAAVLVMLVGIRQASGAGIGGIFGLGGVLYGVGAQLTRPTKPGSRRAFAVAFVVVCIVGILAGDRLPPEDLLVVLALTGGWLAGLSLAASFRPEDGAKVERSFSGQVIRRE